MDITVPDLMDHSFVITISDSRVGKFLTRWEKYIPYSPRIFRGYSMRQGPYGEVSSLFGSVSVNISMSHLAVIKMAESMGYPYVFILEDDALPCRDVINKLEYNLSGIPDNTDLLKLGWTPHARRYTPPDEKYQRIGTWGSHAYIVFKKYYRDYERIFNTVNMVADHDLMNTNSMDIIATQTPLFVQRSPLPGYIEAHPEGSRDMEWRELSFPYMKDFDLK